METNTTLSKSRWQGRLIGMLFHIALQQNISRESIGKMTMMELYLKVLSLATNDEKEILRILSNKLSTSSNQKNDGNDYNEKNEEQIGFNEAIKIRNQYGNFNKIIEERDFNEEEKKRKKKINIITLSIIGAIILAITIYNLPYFKEIRFYNQVVEAADENICNEYIQQYPQGRHIEDVYLLKIDLTNNMTNISSYIQEFPQGKYVTRVNQICDSLWDIEIEKYNAKDKSQSNPYAVKYMNELLQYMKNNRINTINLSINPNIKLKDFNSYSENIRELIKFFYETPELPFDENLVSITEEFTNADNYTLCEILSGGLQRSLNRIFTPDFFAITSEINDTKSPQVIFNYTIKNQEESDYGITVPVIWTYSESTSTYGINTQYKPKAYLIGIAINLDASFTIPNSSTTFHYQEEGEPSDNINDIKNIKDGYRRMTTVCFKIFSNEMINNLGLEGVYQ